MKQNITLEEAQALLLERVKEPRSESVSLMNALGRIVSQDILAPFPMPHFDRSPLDGYALVAADTVLASEQQPVRLTVLEEVPAGHVPTQKVVHGTTIKVMTGAPIPEGADVVVKYEEVLRKEDDILVSKPLKPRTDIVYAGEDMKKGEFAVAQGTVVTPAVIGLLASFGMAEIPVFQQLKAAVLSTGDELIDIHEPLSLGKIYDSNRHTLQARCLELGIKPIELGNVCDKKEKVVQYIQKGLAEADIVITTGGVSVGDYDVVKEALEAAGAETLFWRVQLKPGTPIVAAAKGNKLIIGLSGNPVAALLTFDLLVVPLLKKMLGQSHYGYSRIEGILVDGFKKSSLERRFLRGRLVSDLENNKIRLTGIQNNSAMKSMIECNVLVDIPAGSGPLKPGEKVAALLIGSVHNRGEL